MKFTIFYITFLILSSMFRFGRNRATRNREGGITYFKPIFALQFWLYVALLILAITEFFLVDKKINFSVSLFGLAIYLAGVICREWAIKTLGKYWSADIRIKEDHQLVKEGPYRYVRHPNLVCLLLEINGLCLIPNSYYSLIFVYLAYFPLILVRIHLEEKALIERFGQEYKDYRKEVFAFLPIKKEVFRKMRRYLIGFGSMVIFALPTVACSGGYEFGGLGAKAISMGGAFIGLADDWTSIYWNPAGLAKLEGKGVASYLEYAIIRGKDGNSVANNIIYPTEPSKFTKEEIGVEAILPSLGYWQKFKGFTLGGGIYTPNGNVIDWEDTAKDDTSGADIKASYHTLLFMSVGNISLAKEITDDLSVGAGLNLVYGKFELETKKNYSSVTMSNLDYSFVYKVEGDGTALEGIVGFVFKPSVNISLGGVVRSGSLLGLEGNGEASLRGRTVEARGYACSEKSDYTQNFAYPATCGFGLSYKPTLKITLTCDWARTYWNSMEEDIDFDKDTGDTPDAHTTALLKDKDESLNWSNTDRFRIGIEYRVGQDWSLRAGFFTDPSPVPSKGVDITKLIDVDCNFITLGAGYKRERWQLDLSYAHSYGKETLNGVKYKEEGGAASLTGIYRF